MHYADTVYVGQVSFQKVPQVPAGSFGNTQASAADPLDATKVKHQYVKTLAQVHGTPAATERRVVHVARAAGNVVAAEAGHVVAGAAGATLTVDVRKNGTTVLTGAISHDVTAAAFAETAGAVDATPAAYVAGDVIEVVITATAGAGTLPQGVYANVVMREGAG